MAELLFVAFPKHSLNFSREAATARPKVRFAVAPPGLRFRFCIIPGAAAPG